jgi:hypothetical protein
VIVKSAHPVPISPPFPIPASLRSAMNSGKLRRHTPRRACRPSLSSFSFRSAFRVIRSSHLSWHVDNAEYEASAWKVYLCNERLIRAESEDSVMLKRVVRGVRRAA